MVEGGFHRLPSICARLAAERGVAFRFNTPVAEVLVQRGRAVGVQLAGGEQLPADAVLCNADSAAVAAGLFGQRPRRAVRHLPRSARSLSAVTFSIDAATSGFPLVRHNVFFSGDYAGEFEAIFDRGALPTEPTVYICAQDRNDDSTAPDGPERLLCLVNAPPRGDIKPFEPIEIEQCEQHTFDLLARCGLHVDLAPSRRVVTTPTDFEHLFPATGGALYGRTSHGWQGPFSRSGARSRIPRLYLTGGSVHPGPGVPMAAISGRLAAEAVLADLSST
jgi:1-hydroxycarotenoid 3,4-desaturase